MAIHISGGMINGKSLMVCVPNADVRVLSLSSPAISIWQGYMLYSNGTLLATLVAGAGSSGVIRDSGICDKVMAFTIMAPSSQRSRREQAPVAFLFLENISTGGSAQCVICNNMVFY